MRELVTLVGGWLRCARQQIWVMTALSEVETAGRGADVCSIITAALIRLSEQRLRAGQETRTTSTRPAVPSVVQRRCINMPR
jgi:hypothetical protein